MGVATDRAIRPADRTREIRYAVRDVILLADQARKAGRDMLYLNIGDPNIFDFEPPEHIVRATHEAMVANRNGYAPSSGIETAIDAVNAEAERKGISAICHTYVTSGASEAIDLALAALVNPGDNVLTPSPGYPLYTAVLAKLDAVNRSYYLDESNGWQPDLDDLRAKIDERTKAIVLINPNNPTGSLTGPDVLQELVEIAIEHNLVIFSDEIYDKLVFDGGVHRSTAALSSEAKIITFNGLSKAYVVPGFRIGWGIISGPADELEEYCEAIRKMERARLSANHPEQYAIKPALEGKQTHLDDMMARLTRRRDVTYEHLNAIDGISCVRPGGAFYAFPKIDLGVPDDEFCQRVIRETGVVIVPGSGFGQRPGTQHFRVVFLPPEELLTEAFARIESIAPPPARDAMKARELHNLGVPKQAIRVAQEVFGRAVRDGHGKSYVRARVAEVIEDPKRFLADPLYGVLAHALIPPEPTSAPEYRAGSPAPCRIWGEGLEAQAVEQMTHACTLPVAVRGALMPDAHLGYGLPIGGVLAAENAVIPYAVGVDIACRMKMTVLDLSPNAIEGQTDRLAGAIETETRFGIGAEFKDPNDHPVLDEDWRLEPLGPAGRDKARRQLGSSGSGNHFVEFGTLTLTERSDDLGLDAGTYVALLSHSGSRGVGAAVCAHYSKIAAARHPGLPKQLKHLAWLDLDSDAGAQYWEAMSLMGRYAAANHEIIHRRIARHLKTDVIAGVENHHNFAWKERHEDRNVVVHRKGATPAGPGVLGIIPGSMASPAYVVRGKGGADSLDSASHGAGRVMSRTQAKRSFTWSDVRKQLADRKVLLLSAGLDEVPGVYKDIDEVMAAQRDLVEPIGRFDPRIVKMAPPGERAED